MGIAFALVAGCFNSLTNFWVKKGVDVRGMPKPFFLCQILASTLFALLLGPVLKGEFSIPLYPALLGVGAGLVLYVMLFSLGKAIEKGTPGLTFAILNSATILPGIIMAIFFGKDHGFYISASHLLGLLFVLLGLFWGLGGPSQILERKAWLLFSLIVFLFHVFLLCLYQYKAMVVSVYHLKQFDSTWFAPFMFFSCSSIQLLVYPFCVNNLPSRQEIFAGVAGGLSNLLCTVALLISASKAVAFENAMIFPIASIVCIFLTNLWSQKLYAEPVNWRAAQLLLAGILIGTVNWKVVFTHASSLITSS